MADIKKLIEDGEEILPVTTSKAVFTPDGKTIDQSLLEVKTGMVKAAIWNGDIAPDNESNIMERVNKLERLLSKYDKFVQTLAISTEMYYIDDNNVHNIYNSLSIGSIPSSFNEMSNKKIVIKTQGCVNGSCEKVIKLVLRGLGGNAENIVSELTLLSDLQGSFDIECTIQKVDGSAQKVITKYTVGDKSFVFSYDTNANMNIELFPSIIVNMNIPIQGSDYIEFYNMEVSMVQ